MDDRAPVPVERHPRLRGIARFLRSIGPAGPVALLATAMPAVGAAVVFSLAPVIVPWLHRHGIAGLVVFVICFAVLGGFALVPTYANAIIGGWTYKFAIGFPAVLLGLAGAGMICYSLAHRIVGHRVGGGILAHPQG